MKKAKCCWFADAAAAAFISFAISFCTSFLITYIVDRVNAICVTGELVFFIIYPFIVCDFFCRLKFSIPSLSINFLIIHICCADLFVQLFL